ncbi:DUF6010 family protein [Nannocystis pusilla]|uniref:DUF6010 family protein n=1 Tax=Nannocystis pusilla TaxID=889268 RepID=A0A9X3ETJ9_9BACT|nr:DUF6010 family protein [Nannocystis pusilla]MCY1009204.1 DUF6010 family protein [Nannocystis pusilla]
MHHAFTVQDAALAVAVAFVFVLLVSRLREPTRHQFMAIFVAGAGSAYLGGGLGGWEFAYAAAASYAAFRGLASYRWIAAAWLMHVGWDVAHHLWGQPIVPFVPTSSAQCAVTDSLLAVWFYYGAPTLGPRRMS